MGRGRGKARDRRCSQQLATELGSSPFRDENEDQQITLQVCAGRQAKARAQAASPRDYNEAIKNVPSVAQVSPLAQHQAHGDDFEQHFRREQQRKDQLRLADGPVEGVGRIKLPRGSDDRVVCHRKHDAVRDDQKAAGGELGRSILAEASSG